MPGLVRGPVAGDAGGDTVISPGATSFGSKAGVAGSWQPTHSRCQPSPPGSTSSWQRSGPRSVGRGGGWAGLLQGRQPVAGTPTPNHSFPGGLEPPSLGKPRVEPAPHGPLGLSPRPAFPLGWAWPPWAPLVVSGPTGSRLEPPQLPSAPHPLGSVCLGPLSAPHKQELPQGPGTRVLHGGWGAEAGWLDFTPGPGLPTSLCTGQSCDHHPPRPLGRASRNGAGTWALSRDVQSVLPSTRRRQGPLLRSLGQPVL